MVCITAPLVGVLFGGKFVDSYGGYTSKYALTICLYFAVFTSLTALPLPFINDFYFFVLDLWLCLFFGACLMPPITGIMICSMPKDLRPMG